MSLKNGARNNWTNPTIQQPIVTEAPNLSSEDTTQETTQEITNNANNASNGNNANTNEPNINRNTR